MKRALWILVLCAAMSAWAADDLSFSVGVKYWTGEVEADRSSGDASRSDTGDGALGGITLAVAKNRWTFSLTYLDEMEEYEIPADPDFPDYTSAYSKKDLDLGVNYKLTDMFGLMLGYKRSDTEFNTEYAGEHVGGSDISLSGIYGGAYVLFPLPSINSVISASAGYGFLSTSDLDFDSGESYDADDATGPTWELGWNLALNQWVFSLSYKVQDFEFEVTRPSDGFTYDRSDYTDGIVAGIRYVF